MKIKARFYTFEEWFKKVQELASKEHININIDSLVLTLYKDKVSVEVAASDLVYYERLIQSLYPYNNYEDPE